MSTEQFDLASVCSVCAEDIEEGGTLLDCGHSFHATCVLEWFRYYSDACPNCRSEGVAERWEHVKPEERIEQLRRSRSSLSVEARKKLASMEKKQKRLRSLRAESAEFSALHSGILKKGQRYANRIRSLASEVDNLRDDLCMLHAPGSRLLRRTDPQPL